MTPPLRLRKCASNPLRAPCRRPWPEVRDQLNAMLRGWSGWRRSASRPQAGAWHPTPPRRPWARERTTFRTVLDGSQLLTLLETPDRSGQRCTGYQNKKSEYLSFKSNHAYLGSSRGKVLGATRRSRGHCHNGPAFWRLGSREQARSKKYKIAIEAELHSASLDLRDVEKRDHHSFDAPSVARAG